MTLRRIASFALDLLGFIAFTVSIYMLYCLGSALID